MSREDKNLIYITIAILFICSIFLIFLNIQKYNESVKGIATVSFEQEPTITIVPDLNISRFSSYQINASNIVGTPNSVEVNISGLNGDGGECWDYFADGTCDSRIVTKLLTYSQDLNAYVTGNIYPDSIYPEIYFANSTITWNNTPSELNIRRNDYHIMHFNNPFTVVNDSYFYIEFNVEPSSYVNSADLQVYLVEKNNGVEFFNTDWINDPTRRVELVGTFSKDSPVTHTHTVNSSHRIVALSTNANGTVGPKEIDINDDFWVVLYSNSPNNARGWKLRYHDSALCNNDSRWYRANQTGWTTTAQAGCPDSHIHIARRNVNYMDGIEVTLNANYGDYIAQSEINNFYFGELPNLSPSSTSFTTPTIGGTYAGELQIQWEPATDPNNDTLRYNVYLTKALEEPIEIALQTLNTSVQLLTTSYTDGNYSLTAEVCDGVNPCVPFSLGGEFTISNTLPIQQVSTISLSSSNIVPNYAKLGDIVTLSFTTTGLISNPAVNLYSAGDEVSVIEELNEGNTWTYTFVVDENQTEGSVTFTISSNTLDKDYFDTTNSSSVLIDRTPPEVPQVNNLPGTYPSTSILEIELSSIGSSKILYTTENISLDCNTGTLYSGPITILSDTTIKTIACDIAGNVSESISYSYLIREDLVNITVFSNNISNSWAKVGDIITLRFESSGTINAPVVEFYSGELLVSNSVYITNIIDNTWEAMYLVSEEDLGGEITFLITSTDLYTTFNSTTDSTSVSIDKVVPLVPTTSVVPGLYKSSQVVTLSSSGHILIKYTLGDEELDCTTGLLYTTPIPILSTSTIRAIACDYAGNKSQEAAFYYLLDTSVTLVQEPPVEQGIVFTFPTIEKTNNVNDLNSDENKYLTKIIKDGDKIFFSSFKLKVIEEDKTTLNNIFITLYSTPQSSITDTNGIATFTNVEVGNHTVEFTYQGNEYQEEINVKEPLEDKDEVELEIMTIQITEKVSIVDIAILVLLIGTISSILYLTFFRKK